MGHFVHIVIIFLSLVCCRRIDDMSNRNSGKVFITHFSVDDCDDSSWVDSYQMGLTTTVCTRTKIAGEEYYYFSNCNEDEGLYVVHYFVDPSCEDNIFNQSFSFYPDCTSDPEILDYWIMGTCNYELPTEYSEMVMYPQVSRNSSFCNGTYKPSYNIVMRPGMCTEVPKPSGWGEIKSCQTFCEIEGRTGVFFYNDRNCKNIVEKVSIESGKCTNIPNLPLAVIVSDCVT